MVVGAKLLPVASVLVDTGVLHLSEPFDYLVPEKISNRVIAGALVKVPFNSGFAQGYVITRKESADVAKIKAIESVISPLPLFTPDLQVLLKSVAHRYACSIWDVVRSAIPPRVAAVEKEFIDFPTATEISTIIPSPSHQYIALPRSPQAIELLIKELTEIATQSPVLIVVPDERDLIQIERVLANHGFSDFVVLGTHQEKSDRYRSFLRSRFDAPKIILGTRSAIFTPLPRGASICILHDGEESFYEKRSPGWNVRDIALLRAHENSLIFANFSPSLEIARLVESGWLIPRTLGNLPSVKFTFAESRDSHNSVISRGLARGNVLVTLSAPGYVSSFSCQKCRNMALCDCGGRLTLASSKIPVCSICQKSDADWRCKWCGEQKPRAIRRGTDRYAEEYGRAFPNIHIVVSNGSHQVHELGAGRHLVLATNGCEPDAEYAAIVLLDGELLLNRAELRGDESARKHWASAISHIAPDGEIFLSLPASHPTAQSLEQWKTLELSILESHQRSEATLPPEFRIAVIEGENKDISKIAIAIEEKKDLISLLIVPIDVLNSRAILRSPVEKSSEFSNFLYDLMRYRSLKGESSLRVRIDPFNI